MIPTIRAICLISLRSLTSPAGWAKTGADFGRLSLADKLIRRDPIETPMRAALKLLLVSALALPVVECVLIGVRSLVLSMGDAAGGEMLTRLATACLALWGVSLVGLIIVVAISHVVDAEVGREDAGES